MNLELFQEVSLTRHLPDLDLRAGDLATLVDFVAHPDQEEDGGERGAVLELFNAIGESIAVITVPVPAIESLRADQVPSVRTIAHAA